MFIVAVTKLAMIELLGKFGKSIWFTRLDTTFPFK